MKDRIAAKNPRGEFARKASSKMRVVRQNPSIPDAVEQEYPPIKKRDSLKYSTLYPERPGNLAGEKQFDMILRVLADTNQIIEKLVNESIEPLCAIAAQRTRIDRLNQENTVALERLLNGR